MLEVRLPGFSGYEVCRQLRERHGDRLAIVFVSGDRVEPSDRVAGLLVGADDYLTKPVAGDELAVRVRRLCAGRVPTSRSVYQLTARERQVLTLLSEGLGPVEIGRKLLIRPRPWAPTWSTSTPSSTCTPAPSSGEGVPALARRCFVNRARCSARRGLMHQCDSGREADAFRGFASRIREEADPRLRS